MSAAPRTRRPRGFSDELIDRLFVNGSGERAARLVLELPGGRDGGGWCERAVRDQIRAALNAWIDPVEPVKAKRSGRKS